MYIMTMIETYIPNYYHAPNPCHAYQASLSHISSNLTLPKPNQWSTDYTAAVHFVEDVGHVSWSFNLVKAGLVSNLKWRIKAQFSYPDPSLKVSQYFYLKILAQTFYSTIVFSFQEV